MALLCLVSSAEKDSELSSVQSILTANLHVFLSWFISTVEIKISTDIDNVNLQTILLIGMSRLVTVLVVDCFISITEK